MNILFTQRILRALHPKFGWNPVVSKIFLAILASVLAIIIVNIISLTATFFTLDPNGLKIAKGFLLFGGSYTLFLSVFPFLVILPASLIPGPVERFGVGPFRFKVFLLMFATAAFATGSITRLFAATQDAPANAPPPVDRKAVFYITGFVLEILVVALYAVCRIDLIFHVPDACTGPGDYAAGYAPRSDEEEFFQNIDVKMRMSATQSILTTPSQTWQEKGRFDIQSVDAQPYGDNYEPPRTPGTPRRASQTPLSRQVYTPATRNSQGYFEQRVTLREGEYAGAGQQQSSSYPSGYPASVAPTTASSVGLNPFMKEARAAAVQEAMRDLELKAGIEGQYLDTGDSEVMLYAFKVKPEYALTPSTTQSAPFMETAPKPLDIRRSATQPTVDRSTGYSASVYPRDNEGRY